MNHDTTYRFGSIFFMAEQAVREAEAAARQAFWTWQQTGRIEDQTRWMQLDKVWQETIAQRDGLKSGKKHMHGTVPAEVEA